MSQSSGAYGEADATEQKNESKGQPHNTASTDIRMTDFGVTHLPIRQAYSFTRAS